MLNAATLMLLNLLGNMPKIPAPTSFIILISQLQKYGIHDIVKQIIG